MMRIVTSVPKDLPPKIAILVRRASGQFSPFHRIAIDVR
jgi:hypothetical protein